MHISNEHLLTLKNLEGFGPATIKLIADYIESSSYKSLDLSDLYDVLNELLANNIIKGAAKKNFPDKNLLEEANGRACRILDSSDSLGIRMINQYDPKFPRNLLSTVTEEGKPSVPLYLFYKGDLTITQKKAVAIIGTREPTPDGVTAGRYIAKMFAEDGYNIVSGLAVGCDTAGHLGALDAIGGVTTAFLANGLDSIYPPENQVLADKIISQGGLLMSEYSIGMMANRYNLVERDRLQAALADATIVIQTGVTGGTMHAVNATVKAGKPLFVVEYQKQLPQDKIDGYYFLKGEKGAMSISGSQVLETIDKLNDHYAQSKSPIRQSLEDINNNSTQSSPSQRNEPVQLRIPFE